MLTYRVVRRELEEVGRQDGGSEESQENEATNSRVPHIQVICGQDKDRVNSTGLSEMTAVDLGRESRTQNLALPEGLLEVEMLA